MKLPDSVIAAAQAQAERLMSELGGVVAVVVSTADGFDVASKAKDPAQVSRMAAMASSMSAIGQVVGQESFLGTHRSITLDAEHGFVVMVEVRRGDVPLIMSVVTTRNALLGQVLYGANEAAQALAAAAT
jgi:predicted regulator of Ras-like GTPase activity (Roadblock/LC7/MglB family)